MDYIYDKFSTYSIYIVSIQILLKLLPWLYENIGPMVFGKKVNFREHGQWALVTGATDGIGKSYAKQLAKEGMNMILISRTQSKLERVAAEIQVEYKVRTKILAIDFNGGLEIYKKIADEIKDYDIGVLVNNVGVSVEYPDQFLEVPDNETLYDQIIRCNTHSVVYMSKIVLPQMLKKNKGIIINLSSLSGTIPTPMLTVYAASKAFIDKFSDDLANEYYSKGIIIQSIIPAFVATKMTKITDLNIFMPDADKYVESAIKTVGYATHSAGYLPHAIKQKGIQLFYAYCPLPSGISTMLVMRYIRGESLKLVRAYQAKSN